MGKIKKIVIIYIVIILFLGSINTTHAYSNSNDIKIFLNGEKVDFNDTLPIAINNRILVPARAIFEKLGLVVDWDQETKTAIGEKEGLTIKLPIDNNIAIVNGNEIELDVPAKIINQRILVPLRFVSESAGLKVDWDGTTNSVILTEEKEVRIAVSLKDKENKLLNMEKELSNLFDEGEFDILERNLLELEKQIKNTIDKYTFSNGDIVYGEFDNDGYIDGNSVYIWSNGDKYIGKYIHGRRTGLGVYYWYDGEKYVGDFVDSSSDGKGAYYWNNGDKYIGEFISDIRTGKGIYSWNDKVKFIGDFINGYMTGKGVMYWTDGDKYIGDFVDDKRNGEGVFYWSNGDKYIGEFKDNISNGKGRYYWSNGDLTPYGDFINGEYTDKYYGLKYSEMIFEPKNNQNTLIILTDFNDIKIENDETDWNNLLFDVNSKSVNDYYNEVSKGKISFKPAKETYGKEDGVVKVSLDYNHPNPPGLSDIQEKISHDAIEAADEYVDFNIFDENNNGSLEAQELNIIVVLAGYDEAEGPSNRPGIRAHQNVLFDYSLILDDTDINEYVQVSDMIYEQGYGEYMNTIGTISHELAHNLGLPDLYDTDESSLGIGVHSLMSGGSHTYILDEGMGSTPVHLDAYSKVKLGIIEPTIIEKSGEYLVYSFESEKHNIIKIPTIKENEYFLIENRQFKGYDEGLDYKIKNSGIAIWHIDESVIDEFEVLNQVNDNEYLKGVDLEEANESILGYSQLDENIGYSLNRIYEHYYSKDTFNEFNPYTVPNSNLNNGEDSGISIKIIQDGDPVRVYISVP